MDWQTLTDTLRSRLRPSGLDLVVPLRVGLYNDAVPEAYRLPDLGRPDRLAVLVANTRAVWEPFREARRTRPELQGPHPLDRYVEGAVAAALEGLPEPREVRHGHEPPPRRVAMQRLADVAGLAWTSPALLSVHPEFGPWIGMRSVLVFDVPGPEEPPRPAPPCPHCDEGCKPALARALDAGWSDDDPRSWRAWVAVRDACPCGREHRYGEAQIRYHYTKDPAALEG